MRFANSALFFSVLILSCLAPTTTPAAEPKPRLVVMTDIGGDPDDEQSIVRFLVYACDFEVEGLCTGFGHGHYKGTRPDLLHKAVDAYGQVLPNLLKHRNDYPSYEAMKKLIKDGSSADPHSVGSNRDSEASDWIIKVLDRDDPRPVWFSIWGGPRELAQAIWKVQNTRTPEQLAAFKRKIRVHSIADQDRTALWVKQHHPDVFWIFSKDQFRGIWKEGDQAIVSSQWLESNVRTGHGPLGEIYPAKAAGKVGVKEGDTPSFLYVLPIGLSDPQHPEWGNWGGRFQPANPPVGRVPLPGASTANPPVGRVPLPGEFIPAADLRGAKPDVLFAVHRWREAYQNSFEARMDWCVKAPAEANHEPVAVLGGDKSRRALEIQTAPGATVKLSAAGSSDPDGNTLKYRWWTYVEAGTYWAAPAMTGAQTSEAVVTVPAEASGRAIHVILEVSDTGKPPLVAYRRAILNVSGQPVPPPANTQHAQQELPPPPVQFVAAPAGPWAFQRAVDVNGEPAEIEGRQWEGDAAANFTCNGKPLVTELKPQPPTDATRTSMLNSFRFNRELEASFSNLAPGTYAVFAHVMEDNRSEKLNFFLEGRIVERNYASGSVGQWRRLGPWVARVTDGTLNLTSHGGAANLSGLELWKLNEPTPAR